jgi:hypothetical protein
MQMLQNTQTYDSTLSTGILCLAPNNPKHEKPKNPTPKNEIESYMQDRRNAAACFAITQV